MGKRNNIEEGNHMNLFEYKCMACLVEKREPPTRELDHPKKCKNCGKHICPTCMNSDEKARKGVCPDCGGELYLPYL